MKRSYKNTEKQKVPLFNSDLLAGNFQKSIKTYLPELKGKPEDNQELMDLLKGYVSVQMDKQALTKVTIDQELEQIRETSKTVQQEMISILKKQEQRSPAEGFGKWQDRNESKQQTDDPAASKHPERSQSTLRRDQETHATRNQSHEPKRAKQFKRTRSQQQSYDLER